MGWRWPPPSKTQRLSLGRSGQQTSFDSLEADSRRRRRRRRRKNQKESERRRQRRRRALPFDGQPVYGFPSYYEPMRSSGRMNRADRGLPFEGQPSMNPYSTGASDLRTFHSQLSPPLPSSPSLEQQSTNIQNLTQSGQDLRGRRTQSLEQLLSPLNQDKQIMPANITPEVHAVPEGMQNWEVVPVPCGCSHSKRGDDRRRHGSHRRTYGRSNRRSHSQQPHNSRRRRNY